MCVSDPALLGTKRGIGKHQRGILDNRTGKYYKSATKISEIVARDINLSPKTTVADNLNRSGRIRMQFLRDCHCSVSNDVMIANQQAGRATTKEEVRTACEKETDTKCPTMLLHDGVTREIKSAYEQAKYVFDPAQNYLNPAPAQNMLH